MKTCPACNQEAEDTGLGTLLPHYLPGGAQSSQEFCPGFVQEASPDPAPKALPGRKVRSDKGTKRGQRKRGGDAYVPGLHANSKAAGVHAAPGGPAEPGLANELAARPPTKVEDWMKITPRTSITALDSTMGDAVPKPHGSHVADAPRAGYVATAPDWQPLIHATYDEADDAATEALRGAAARVIIYWVTPIEEISNGLIRQRLGRVRKEKP